MDFRIGDEVGNVLDGNRWIHHHDEGRAGGARDRFDVADEVVGKIRFERGVDIIARDTKSSVYPSGGACTTCSVAIVLAAPGRLSMTNDWPSRSDSHCPSRRALMSAAWPGGKPTTMCTGRVG